MLTVYGASSSGNCHKIRMLLNHLQQPYVWREVDFMAGDTHTLDFLAMNPNGRVPTIEIKPGTYLAESNAILCYLAEGTPLWPTDRLARAKTLQWLFFEQYSHEPYIAVARFIVGFLPSGSQRRAELPRLLERGRQALAVMERHLRQRRYFVDDQFGLADIALYAYTHAASDGGFDLVPYPAVRHWLARVEARPGCEAMPKPPRVI